MRPMLSLCLLALLSGATIDAMTSSELKAAVTHNRHGEAECGWKAPGRTS